MSPQLKKIDNSEGAPLVIDIKRFLWHFLALTLRFTFCFIKLLKIEL